MSDTFSPYTRSSRILEEDEEMRIKWIETREELLAKKAALRQRMVQELFKSEKQNFYKVSLFVNMM